MEINEKEKIVIAKPVAHRPGFSSCKSFSELFSSAAIRPTTMRFKPAGNCDLVESELLGSPKKPNTLYKPIAKFVSKATVDLLANLGSTSTINSREIAQVGFHIHPSNQDNYETEPTSNFHPNLPPHSEQTQKKLFLEYSEDGKRLLNADRPHDGHNWRKYGQKQVKGCEYPRSYYKCTHLNCPVKKMVEGTIDGGIAETVYKGEHNHQINLVEQLQKSSFDDDARKEAGNSFCGEKNDEKIESENLNVVDSSAQSSFLGVSTPINDVNASFENSNSSSFGFIVECEKVSEALEGGGDGIKSKRRKHENQSLKPVISGEPSFDPPVVVQNNTESETTGDGFRWRKYGQKVVKGNQYPRSYYRCTHPKCNVRKYVERTSEDGVTFITTYEGRHNHEMPNKSTNSETNKTSMKKK